jgi:hypothetical protein
VACNEAPGAGAAGAARTCAEEGRAHDEGARRLRHALTAPMHACGRVVGTRSLWSGERPLFAADEEIVVTVAALLPLRLTRPSGR